MNYLLIGCAIVIASCLFGMLYCAYHIIKCNKFLKRNDEVYFFRRSLIKEGIFDMPSYEDMLNSNKPLTK